MTSESGSGYVEGYVENAFVGRVFICDHRLFVVILAAPLQPTLGQLHREVIRHRLAGTSEGMVLWSVG